MNRSVLLLLVVMFLTDSLYSQPYGNEWINYNQQYFRITIHQDAIYRIPYSVLIQSGVPADQINPRNLQLFYCGQEQHIYIKGENTSGVFDPNGYIEFYGQRNRAGIDSLAFISPQELVNPDHSMFNDTSSYFLTWNNSLNNRRITEETDINFNQYSANKPQYFWKKIRQNYVSDYVKGSTRCIYGDGEGWFDSEVIRKDHPDGDRTVTKTLQTQNVYSQGPPATLTTAVVGYAASKPENFYPHHLKVGFSGNTIIEEFFTGYSHVNPSVQIPAASLNNQLSLTYSANDATLTTVPDQMLIAYIQLNYPHSMNAAGETYLELQIAPGSGNKQFIQITNFNSSGSNNIVCYDITTHKRITVVSQADNIQFLLPENGNTRQCILAAETAVKTITSLKKIAPDNKFIDYRQQYPNADYFIITHSSLMQSAQQYAAYRTSKGANVVLADVEQLYHQFSHGITKHPLSIRNFLMYMLNHTNRPAFLFLFGKSINSYETRNYPQVYQQCLVPSFGYPPSDNLFSAPFDASGFEPRLATGRISVTDNTQALAYLEKIIEYETNPKDEWMKNVLHFGGGATTAEQTTFAAYLNHYRNIIQDTLFGAYVSTFLKNSSAPIQITQSDSVRNLINNGVSMMTFFGHASATGFDQSIDDPENYQNQSKYPFILANSCFAGDIHLYGAISTSEKWVLENQRGAIAFLASVGEGIPTYLNLYSGQLYRNIASQMYAMPLGFQIINTIQSVQQGNLTNLRMEITCHEFTLHGDPALTLNSFELPDLTIKLSDIKFIPGDINTAIDSFDVQFVITNIGRATAEPFIVNVLRTFPDGSNSEHQVIFNSCLYRDTAVLKLAVDKVFGPGMNRIEIFVDAMNNIEELNESNNYAGINFLVRSGDLFPIHPYEFAIIPQNTVKLLASTGDPFLMQASYLFELDTTDLFNSASGSALLSYQTSSAGGIIEWELPLSLAENKVYYWRIARNHANPDSILWKESSFVYIQGKNGWSQAHFYQFKNNSFQFIEYNRTSRKFDFIEVPRSLQCYNKRDLGSLNYSDVRFTIDGAMNNGFGDHGCCGNQSAMMIAVIDPETLLAYPSDWDDFGHRNYPQCGSSGRVNYYFVFSSGWGESDYSSEDMQRMNNMLLSIPDGHYILAYSFLNGYFEQWDENILATFESLGATHIRNLTNEQAYIFFCRKGFSEPIREANSTVDNPECNIQVDLYTDFNYGNMFSAIVGPSSGWQTFKWNQTPIEPANDSVSVSIIGVRPNNSEQILIDSIGTDTYLLNNLDETIDAGEFSRLKLQFYTRDDITKTPAQLQKWQLYYDLAPETAINPDNGYLFCCDTIDEGDQLTFAVATRNVSSVDMDSLLVAYWILDNTNQIIPIETKRLQPHPAGDFIIDTIAVNTLGMTGLNSVWVEYNPINPETGLYDQIEQHHFNNIAQKFFYVRTDKTNPLLDVSFDGVRIMDGDIVSARPEILIRLKDENKYLALNDTSVFRIFISDVSEGIERRVYFEANSAEYDMFFVPADLPDNSCKIYYKPMFHSDGTYQLRIQATDLSGNESGSYDYVVRFKVITTSAITHVLNYPNPFSTSTRFVFELTGHEIPDDLRIEIFTVTGKLVRVIDKYELGPVRIGRNISDFAWDGTDMYGDRLANGVYFYRVTARINGSVMQHRDSEADNYFGHETGKMYLLR